MKNRLTCYLLLTTLTVVGLCCRHDDDNPPVQTITCMPTILPGYRAAMTISYNNDHKIASVAYDAFPGGAMISYQELYAYFNGRLSRINIRRNGKVGTYKTFTYDSRTITESYYAIGNTDQNNVTVYYLAAAGSRQIVAWARRGQNQRDSVTFTYTGDNVTRMDAYNADDEVEYSYRYEYDDKVNPFALAGLSGEDAEHFKPINISKNNITHIELHYDDNIDHTGFTYTYDKDNRPVTRTMTRGGTDDPAQSISYVCD